ncbi:Galectin, carbohydrate recognition domain [Dillenia turbinata]|uniref:Galectin, carbohydrate recognition domain n=1 Tax=Dillenia turbinata TaxID=194707 RepID=A0AAN8YSG3_9MAGN
MRKWSGGVLISILALLLIFRYSLIGSNQRKQSAKDFFGNPPPNNTSRTRGQDPNASSTIKLKKSLETVKKSHYVNVDGLSILYGPTNFSKEESKVLLVWAQLRSLLSRSDSLPQTAQGVKEGSIAWSDLLSTIEKDKASTFGRNDSVKSKPGDRNCPFSVDTFNNTVRRTGIVLELPCGVVEGSSITVVAVPNGHNGSFQLEFVGSKLSGKPDPPVILHYNVSLPGDNLTEEPVIIQNAWSNELGWGKEEKCPARDSAVHQKVDGLVLCNEEVIRSIAEENLNATDKLTNVSNGSTHVRACFPFVEGNPFTATLWVGDEGFHMSKLEPWLIGGVKVAGHLDVLSALAKALPVPDNLGLVDVEQLKAPPTSRKRITMLVGVFSTGNNFKRRMALRRSWMQYKAVRSGNHNKRQVNIELWKEAQAYGDIQLMPFVDYYNLISLKTVAVCMMGIKILPARYIMKTDDDAFVRIDEVLSCLKEKASSGLLYGRISFDSAPNRDKGGKWYISAQEWPKGSYPPWAHGPGYIISQDIAKFIVQGHQEGSLKPFKLEDVAMGIWIEEFKRSGSAVNYVTDDRFYNAGCESNYILAHYQGPRLLLCLWEKLQKENKAECCE